jgi:hypothetical protein
MHKILTCFKRNAAQEYRHKSQFLTYSKNPEVIILPTTQGVQENKTGYTKMTGMSSTGIITTNYKDL